MVKFKPANLLHPVWVLFPGLFISQILATIQVYLSNIDIYSAAAIIKAEGYLAIPNPQVMQSLINFGPALCGGLFFTLSLGAGISLSAMAAAWIGRRFHWNTGVGAAVVLTVWVGCLLFVNFNGFILIPTLYFLMIPPVVFFATSKWLVSPQKEVHRGYRIINLLPVPLLALLWLTQLDDNLFLDLRDHLLLSNAAGKKFSRFYYTYTLYPAEAFKSLDQKMIRTCKLENIQNRALLRSLEETLRNNDYLPINADREGNLIITLKDDRLIFADQEREYLQLNINDFFSDPKRVLKTYASGADPFGGFRQLTFLALLCGFPLTIYVGLHALFYYALFPWVQRRNSTMIASLMCFLAGFIVLIYFQSNRVSLIGMNNLAVALQSEDWQSRVAALKLIQQANLEISSYSVYPPLLKSNFAQERYWLVKALAVSRQPHTYRDILLFLDDPDPQVRSVAFYALGQRKDPRAIRPILAKIESSDDWYSQLNAYKALRSLGWKQTRSHSKPLPLPLPPS
jgi:hypothetical protein